MESLPRFQVGDIVQVVDTPHYGNAFSWVSVMDEHCGKVTKITRVTKNHWMQELGIYGYEIEGSTAMWDENCFVSPEPDINESDVDLAVLLGGEF